MRSSSTGCLQDFGAIGGGAGGGGAGGAGGECASGECASGEGAGGGHGGSERGGSERGGSGHRGSAHGGSERGGSERAGSGRESGRIGALAAHVLATALAAAFSTKPNKPEPVTSRELPPPVPRTDGAIYQAGQEMALFADLKARRVGDVLTIVLNEATTASKNAATTTSRTSAVTDTGPALFGKSITTKGVPILDTTLSGSHTFDGEGTASQGNSFVGSLTVTVTEVKSNGNLVVVGDKTLKLNQGDEFIHISGMVRPADVATNNTVTSDKIADAHISYSGKGVIANANRMGWLTRFFNSVLSPF
jgi:flagellar L-ring protein precursor FlgH